MTEHPPPTVVVAVADSIGGNAALPRALRSLVIVPVLEEFRVAPCEVPVGSDAEGSAQAQARRRIESARIVIAEVAGASPEVLLSLGWRRGREAGRTILLAPTTWPEGPPDEKALRYPPSARAVGRAQDLSLIHI